MFQAGLEEEKIYQQKIKVNRRTNRHTNRQGREPDTVKFEECIKLISMRNKKHAHGKSIVYVGKRGKNERDNCWG